VNETYIRDMPVLEGQCPTKVMELAFLMERCYIGPDEDIISAGSLGSEMFFILEGRVEVLFQQTGINGREKVTRRLSSLGIGQFFGEMALLDPGHIRSTTVRTLSFCEFRTLSREKFLAISEKYPGFGEHLVELIGDRMKRHEVAKEQKLKKEEAKRGKRKKTVVVGNGETKEEPRAGGGDWSILQPIDRAIALPSPDSGPVGGSNAAAVAEKSKLLVEVASTAVVEVKSKLPEDSFNHSKNVELANLKEVLSVINSSRDSQAAMLNSVQALEAQVDELRQKQGILLSAVSSIASVRGSGNFCRPPNSPPPLPTALVS